MDAGDFHTVILGAAVIVVAAGAIAAFRWLTGWVARRLASEFRDAVAEIVYELRPNGGNSAVDRLAAQIAAVTGRVDGVNAELARKIDDGFVAAAAERQVLGDRLETHLASSEEFGGLIAAEGEKVLARLDLLEQAAPKTTVNVNVPPGSQTT